MRPMFWCIGLFFLMMFGFEFPQLRAQQPKNSLVSVDGFKTELISRFMEQQCLDCHSPDSSESGLDLSSFAKQGPTSETLELWIQLHDRVVAGEMPPKSKLKQEEVDPFTSVLFDRLVQLDQQALACWNDQMDICFSRTAQNFAT